MELVQDRVQWRALVLAVNLPILVAQCYLVLTFGSCSIIVRLWTVLANQTPPNLLLQTPEFPCDDYENGKWKRRVETVFVLNHFILHVILKLHSLK
jgi:hypothetical protein